MHSEIVIESHSLVNVTVEYVRQISSFNSSENSTTNNTLESSSYSTDVPTITEITSLGGNLTQVNYSWTPSSVNVTGFSILATDKRLGSALYTPNVHYCMCEHPKAECIFNSDNDTDDEEISATIRNDTITTENITNFDNITIPENSSMAQSNATSRITKGKSKCIRIFFRSSFSSSS